MIELVSDHFSERTLRAADGYPSVLCSLPSSFLGANPFLCNTALLETNLPVWLAAIISQIPLCVLLMAILLFSVLFPLPSWGLAASFGDLWRPVGVCLLSSVFSLLSPLFSLLSSPCRRGLARPRSHELSHSLDS